MTPLIAWVAASELRVGDRALIDGVEGDVSEIRSYRGYLYVVMGRVRYLIEPARQVQVVLEDDGL